MAILLKNSKGKTKLETVVHHKFRFKKICCKETIWNLYYR